MGTDINSARETMRSIIGRIATGPELSKSISLEEARIGMHAVINEQVDPVQAAIFLIALRMKRETDDEFRGVLDAVLESTVTVTADVDQLIDIADPYDGYNRTLPASPLLAPVLAALGVPAFSQGVEIMGPKFGITHRQVLRELGVPVDHTPQQAADRISNPAIGWAYLDQSQFNPRVHQLRDLRTLIVKRPVLTTVEVLASPIRGRIKTHFVTGYVHKPYPRIYALLAKHAGFDSALFVRGVEGGVVPSLRQTGKFVYYRDKGEEQSMQIEPAELGIQQTVRSAALPEELSKRGDGGDIVTSKVDAPAAAKVAAKMGRDALQGEPGPIRDGLIYTAAMCLWNIGKFNTPAAAASAVGEILDSGKVMERITT